MDSGRVKFWLLLGISFIAIGPNKAFADDPETPNDAHGSSNYFIGITPLSPSVWNTPTEEIHVDNDFSEYLFREAYLVEADHRFLQTDGRMFLVPLDDLASTQQRTVSPYRREEEERQRRDYAESVKSIVINKGLPEYVIQVLGFQSLKEGVKKIERAVSLDVNLSDPSPKVAGEETPKLSKNPWRYRGIFLPYQRSYRMGFTNSIYNLDVQGGATSSKGDQLYGEFAIRWGRYLQSNTYQVLTSTAITSFSVFFKGDWSVTLAYWDEIRNQEETQDMSRTTVGVSYLF